MKRESCKILIIGAGPGGYDCAIRAGQLGLDTIVVEEARAAGTCLNIGCVPSKALIHAAEEFHVAAYLAVVGGGYIGLEIGTAMAKLGAKVTVVEAAGRILPQYDSCRNTTLR